MAGVAPPDKRISTAYKAALRRHKLNQREFADRIGFDSSALTKFAQGQEPSTELLQALFSGWPTAETGWEILRAHLLDECERAGAGSPLLHVGPGAADDRLREDVRKIERFFQNEPDLRDGLHKLAELMYPTTEASVREVAETFDSPAVPSKTREVTYGKPKAGPAKKKPRV